MASSSTGETNKTSSIQGLKWPAVSENSNYQKKYSQLYISALFPRFSSGSSQFNFSSFFAFTSATSKSVAAGSPMPCRTLYLGPPSGVHVMIRSKEEGFNVL